MNIAICEQRLRAEHGLGHEFVFYRWAMMPGYGDPLYCEFEGAVCNLYVRGPKRGKPNYKTARDVRKFAVGLQTAKDWESQWQASTGGCLRCTGTGQIVMRVSAKDGAVRGPCPQCTGTGKMPCPDASTPTHS